MPPQVSQPFNKFEIPEGPIRFSANFIRNRGKRDEMKGRWLYDYVERRMLIEYIVPDKAMKAFYVPHVKGFFIDYRILKVSGLWC